MAINVAKTKLAIATGSGASASQMPSEVATPRPPVKRRKIDAIEPRNAANPTAANPLAGSPANCASGDRNQALQDIAREGNCGGALAAGPRHIGHPDVTRADPTRIESERPPDQHADRNRANQIADRYQRRGRQQDFRPKLEGWSG